VRFKSNNPWPTSRLYFSKTSSPLRTSLYNKNNVNGPIAAVPSSLPYLPFSCLYCHLPPTLNVHFNLFQIIITKSISLLMILAKPATINSKTTRTCSLIILLTPLRAGTALRPVPELVTLFSASPMLLLEPIAGPEPALTTQRLRLTKLAHFVPQLTNRPDSSYSANPNSEISCL
jgi:hypothetical protein